MIRDTLIEHLHAAIAAAQAAGDLPAFDVPAFSLAHPKPDMGDYAASVAMQLARPAKLAPPVIAERIAKHLPAVVPAMYTCEIAGGYINFRLIPAYLAGQVDAVVNAGEAWGNIDLGRGRAAQVEHGSANPTGFATIGTGRNVITGDTLANTLEAAGYRVHREWYVNDAGSQVRAFGASVYAHYCQALGVDEPFPPKAYMGDDVAQIAREIAGRDGRMYLDMPPDEARKALGRLGIDAVMDRIRATLSRLGIRFDNYFSERSLWTSGLATDMLEQLRRRGLIIEHEGAQWFSEDGSPIRGGQGKQRTDDEYAEEVIPDKDEKGRRLPVQAVVIRSARVIADPAERGTYFASDIPYAWNKVMLRGFNPAVYVWGEDHQADVERVYAAARALGLPDGAVRIVIYRFITLMRGGQEVRMGKRKGNAIWADDVLDDIGSDAFRYIMLSRSVDTRFAFDLDLLKEQSDKNPVYYVQYGHARICSIFARANERRPADVAGFDAESLAPEHPSELVLIRKLLELPEVVEQVAITLQPHHYTAYAQSLATAFSKFYDDCPVIREDVPAPLMRARLKLAHAARLTLAKTLRLMGMNTPERM